MKRDYTKPSKLEETGDYRLKQVTDMSGGWPQSQLRKHLGMKEKEIKTRSCLKCAREFEHVSDRICKKCKE